MEEKNQMGNGERRKNLKNNVILPVYLWVIAFVILIILKIANKWELSGYISIAFFLLIPSIIEKSNEKLGLIFSPKDNIIVFALSMTLFSLLLSALFVLDKALDIKYFSPRIPGKEEMKFSLSPSLQWLFLKSYFFAALCSGGSMSSSKEDFHCSK